MAARDIRPRLSLAQLIERQVRNWELSRAQLPRQQEPAPEHEVEDFVTISRMFGAGGLTLAAELGNRLGWPVFDKELLQSMACDDQIHTRLYEALDERDVGWIENTLRWLMREGVDKSQYFHQLGQTILALARKGHAIFVGRGADLLLPRDRGLRVELVATPEHCAQTLAERDNIGTALALAEVERIERERKEFLRTYFGKAVSSPTRYDLVLNTCCFTIDQAAELVQQALRLRGMIP
jgi:cytidylate kinase